MARKQRKPTFIVTWHCPDDVSGCRGFTILTYARRFANLMRYAGATISTEGFDNETRPYTSME